MKEDENYRQPQVFDGHGLMPLGIWCLFGDSIIPENEMNTFTHPQAVSHLSEMNQTISASHSWDVPSAVNS